MRKFTQLLPSCSLALSCLSHKYVSAEEHAPSWAAVSQTQLFKQKRWHTAPGIAEVNLLTVYQSIDETQQLRFAIIVSPSTKKKKAERNWAGSGATLKTHCCPLCLSVVHVVSRCYHPDQSVHLKKLPYSFTSGPVSKHWTHKILHTRYTTPETNKKKIPYFSQFPFLSEQEIQTPHLALSCTTRSFKSWNKNSVLLVTQDTRTWHVWWIFKGVFNIIHFTQQLQVLKLWAWFWSNKMALQWSKAN